MREKLGWLQRILTIIAWFTNSLVPRPHDETESDRNCLQMPPGLEIHWDIETCLLMTQPLLYFDIFHVTI